MKNGLNEERHRKTWWKDNKLHREDGPAVLWNDGHEEWFINGRLHREDGPAVTRITGTRLWFKHGHFHREDGPAVIEENGYKKWYWEGFRVMKYQEFQDLTGHSDQYIMYLKLKWGEINV